MNLNLKPLQKSIAINDAERLTWLRHFFYRHPRPVQRKLFPFLKTDLQASLLKKGFTL